MDDDEAEVARHTIAPQGGVAAGQIHPALCHQVLDDLAQIETHTRLYAETDTHRHAIERVLHQRAATILQRIGRIHILQVDEPIVVGTLRLLVDDGVDQFVVHGTLLSRMIDIDQVGGILGYAIVGLDVGDDLIVVAQRLAGDMLTANTFGTHPHQHHAEKNARDEQRTPSSGKKLGEVGGQEDALYDTVAANKDHAEDARHAPLAQVEAQEQGGHQHRDGDGKSVGGLHVGGVAKEEEDQHHTDIHGHIDRRDKQLALDMSGMLDAHPRPEVEVHRLAQDGERATDEGLACHDGCPCSHHDGEDQQALRHDGIERIDRSRHVGMAEDPRSLPEIVEDEHRLDKGPTHGDVSPATMSQVGIERLRTRSTEKHRAQDEKPLGRRRQQPQSIIGIERPDHLRIGDEADRADHTQQEKPQQHEATKRLADALRAEALHEEDDGDDGQGDGEDGQMWTDALQTLDGRGHGDGRRDDAVGQQGACSHKGQQIDPLSLVATQQGVERQDASLAMVVRPQGHEDILDGSLQGKRPDDARQRTQDHWFVHPLAHMEDGLHHIERRRANVAKDNAQRDKHSNPPHTVAALLDSASISQVTHTMNTINSLYLFGKKPQSYGLNHRA